MGIAQSRLIGLGLLLLLMSVLSQAFFALVSGYLMSFSFFTARHVSIYLSEIIYLLGSIAIVSFGYIVLFLFSTRACLLIAHIV